MKPGSDESGFTLLETVCVVAIFAMLLAIALPALPRATSRPMLEAYAIKTAAILKADRSAAIRQGAVVATELSLMTRTIRPGSGGQPLQLPQDVDFRALIANQCGTRAAGTAIQFLPSGMSCGGTIFLSRPGTALEVRVSWLTGGVEVVPGNAL